MIETHSAGSSPTKIYVLIHVQIRVPAVPQDRGSHFRIKTRSGEIIIKHMWWKVSSPIDSSYFQ